MNKITCFIANPSFGKSAIDDQFVVDQFNGVIKACQENNCRDIVICGGMYSFSKKDINNRRKVEEELKTVSRILPRHLDIRYKILSGAPEVYVLRRNLINMNKELSKSREDVEHLGFDRAIFYDILLKCTYGKQNNLGFNEGELLTYREHTYDPSVRLNNIIQDYDKDLVLIGGKNRFEEFVYNNKIVIALPSLVNPHNSSHSPDIGYIFIDKQDEGIDVKQHVKLLNKKPEFK